MTPFFSIIVPFKNGAIFLPNLIKNLIQQSFTDFEVVFINDGSDDSSMEILQELLIDDKRFNLIHHQSNLGVAISRNDGIKSAKGEYILFVDVDDFLVEDSLKDIANKLKIKVDMLLGRARCFEADKVLNIYSAPKFAIENIKELSSVEILLKLFQAGPFWSPWGHVFRKDFLIEKELFFPNFIAAEDISFVIQAIYNADSIEIFEDYFYLYRQGQANSMSKRYEMDYYFALTIIDLISWAKKSEERSRLIPYLAECFFANLSRTCQYSRDKQRTLYEIYSQNSHIFKLGKKQSHRCLMISLLISLFGIKFSCWLLYHLKKIRFRFFK